MANNFDNLYSNLKEGIRQGAKMALLLFVLTIVLRLSFFGVLLASNNVRWSDFSTVLGGIYFDLFFVLRVTALFIIPFLLLHTFLPKITKGITIGFITIYCIFYGCLIGYYSNVMRPLDQIFFLYKGQDLVDIVISSVKFTLLPFILLLGVVTLYVLFLRFWLRKVALPQWLSTTFVTVSMIFTLFLNYTSLMSNDKRYDTYADYCLATNQMAYTLNTFRNYFNEKRNNRSEQALQYELYDKTVLKKAKEYQSLFPEFTYTDSLYPFMRLADDKDVLGSFMNTTTDGVAPNFVFVIVESYGRNLTAFQPKVSYTPFIDSLASQGLFWPNCLSLAERTFGALPNIFSSAPYDKSGFARPWFPIPDHHSILKDMSRNKYAISYYYGGNLSFDGQNEYLENNGVSYLMQLNEDDFDQAQMELLKNNNSWGIYDRDMFKAAMRRKDSIEEKRPFTDIYLTLTTHEPFYFKGIEAYEKRVMDILNSTPDVGDTERKTITENKNTYACYLYLDDCIRMLLKYYQTKPEFENTIFVIVGDHRMGRIYVNGSELLKYNVPLVVYSPLIKTPRTFQAVVTHHDITPSINAYLSNNYEYHIDSVCHWLGTSFDTTATFSSKVIVPFMRNNREVNEFLYHDKLIVRDRLYTIDERLYPTEIQDTATRNKLARYLDDYQSVDWYVTQNDFLMTRDEKQLENVINYSNEHFLTDSCGLVLNMPEDDYYNIFTPVKIPEDYQKIYVDIICDYKVEGKSKSDNFSFCFSMFNDDKPILWKGYNASSLSTDIPGKTGWKRLRVKTTCFFAHPETEGAVMKFQIKSNGSCNLEISDVNMKIDGIRINQD